MKTIFINTSKEAARTRLDGLFSAPFDRNSLLRYDCELNQIGNAASDIKQALISDADMVDRDYNLIVLVDLYGFPQGNDKHFINIYKQLVSRYIGTTLIYELHDKMNLRPQNTAIYFADSSAKHENFTAQYNNEKEKEEEKKEQLNYQANSYEYEIEEENNTASDLTDKVPATNNKPLYMGRKKEYSYEDKILMQLFSWKEDCKKEDFNWKLRYSITDEIYLDFSSTFEKTADSIKKSDKTADFLGIALIETKKDIIFSHEDSSSAIQQIPEIQGYSVTIHTCSFNRNNEQSLIEGFFKAYANIYTCVQEQKISDSVTDFSKDEIEKLLNEALCKYKYFSAEENIELDIKPVGSVFEKRSSAFERFKKRALENNKYKDMTADDIAKQIMTESNSRKKEKHINTNGMRGTDLTFHNMVEDIFCNYDMDVISEQNNSLIKNCMLTLWDWRDRCTNDEFCQTLVNEQINIDIKNNGLSCESVEFYADDYKKEHNRLVGEITQVEHRLSANKNILLETQDLMSKYAVLMKKGKKYLVSFIGAVIAVLASSIPFIYIQSYSAKKMFVPILISLIFTAFFAALYAGASAIYMMVIRRQKKALSIQLSRIKEASENDRKTSIKALYNYYTNTIIEANFYYLLWQELLKREKENSQKEIMRNAHITKLTELIESIKRYITMLKIQPIEDIAEKTYPDNMKLKGDEPFCSENNRIIYSILDSDERSKKI